MPPHAEEILGDLLDSGARTALLRAEDGERTSYDVLADRVDNIAGRLHAAGVARGDRVALVIPDGPSIVPLMLGIAAVGAAAAPLNPAYTQQEFSFYLSDLMPVALILPAGDMQPARDAAGSAVRVLDVRGSDLDGPYSSNYESAQPDDIALLLHTSGTTSRPKQVPLRHRNLAASARSIAGFYELSPDDVSYCAMPLFHVHGLVASTLAAMSVGGSVVVPKRFLPRRMWTQLAAFGTTWLSAAPTLHSMALDRRADARVTNTLRFVRTCSSALSPQMLDRFEAVYGVPVLEAYGMTEASHQMTSNPLPPRARVPGSVGISAGTAIRVVDKRGTDVESGEVVIRGPGVTSGYVANESANAEAFVDGWFRTGDHGRIENGYLYLEGRIKELIIRGGENISPSEIEDALRAHASVIDAVAFSMPSEKYGEEVAAAVALNEEVSQRVLQSHCREQLAPFKVPVKLFVVPEIPRTATGKVQRRRIADRLLE